MPTIKSITELEALYETPGTTSLVKVTPHITAAYQKLIEASPFCLISSVGPEGLDCSPRGDKAGFVRVIDRNTVAIPDRRGNNRLDTLRNIVRTNTVSLLFLIPGVNETLRINGTAILTTDPELKASFVINGKEPASVIVVTIDEVYFQCARAMIRADLWNSNHQVDRSALPTAGDMIKSAQTDFDADTYDADLSVRHRKTLY